MKSYSGLVQVLFFSVTPPPQLLEHPDHSDSQLDQLPSTARGPLRPIDTH